MKRSKFSAITLLIILIYYQASLTRSSKENSKSKGVLSKSLSNYENRIPKSLNEIKSKKFSDEELYEFFMYGQSNQFNDIDQDKIFKHLSVKNGKLPFDSIIGQKKDNQSSSDSKLEDYDLDDYDINENENEVQMRSTTKLINQLYSGEKIKFFNHKSTTLDAKKYLNDLESVNFAELTATYKAVLRYIHSPFNKYLDVAKFIIQTIRKIFKQLSFHTVLFEIENGKFRFF